MLPAPRLPACMRPDAVTVPAASATRVAWLTPALLENSIVAASESVSASLSLDLRTDGKVRNERGRQDSRHGLSTLGPHALHFIRTAVRTKVAARRQTFAWLKFGLQR